MQQERKKGQFFQSSLDETTKGRKKQNSHRVKSRGYKKEEFDLRLFASASAYVAIFF